MYMRHLQAGRETFRRARYDQVRRDQVLVGVVKGAVRLGHEVQHRVVEEPARDRGHDDGEGAVKHPPSQLGQVLEQGHAGAVAVIRWLRGGPVTVIRWLRGGPVPVEARRSAVLLGRARARRRYR